MKTDLLKKGVIFITALLLLLSLYCLELTGVSHTGEKALTLNGEQFSPLSVGAYSSTQLSGHSCKLFGILRSAYAIYDFRVPKYLDSFAASVRVKNPRGKKIDVYLYNYGTKREQQLLSKPDLEDRWIRWESVLVDGDWRSRSPEFIWAASKTGALDFLGPYGVVRLMFYADGGLPPVFDRDLPNVVLIVHDTLRPDRLDFHGNPGAASPFLGRLDVRFQVLGALQWASAAADDGCCRRHRAYLQEFPPRQSI